MGGGGIHTGWVKEACRQDGKGRHIDMMGGGGTQTGLVKEACRRYRHDGWGRHTDRMVEGCMQMGLVGEACRQDGWGKHFLLYIKTATCIPSLLSFPAPHR